MDGHDLNTVIASESFICHFLPPTHPQKWLPMIFTFSSSFNSATFDDQMLDLFARLVEAHTDPSKSHPERLQPSYVYTSSDSDDTEEDQTGDGGNSTETQALGDNGSDEADEPPLEGDWQGIFRDVGIFSEEEFRVLMTLALKSMGTCQ